MRTLLLVMVAACSGATARQPITNQAWRPVRSVCTEAIVSRFSIALSDRWKVDKLDLRCVAGRFGVDGFFIEARGADLHRTGIVDASAAEVVAFVDEPEHEAATFINGYQAADLDGDGQDEIIESWRRSAHDKLASDSWLIVRRISNRKFASRLQGPYLSRYHPDLGGCSATWELRAGSIIVAVELEPGIPPSDCLPAGRHRFALRHGVLTSMAR